MFFSVEHRTHSVYQRTPRANRTLGSLMKCGPLLSFLDDPSVHDSFCVPRATRCFRFALFVFLFSLLLPLALLNLMWCFLFSLRQKCLRLSFSRRIENMTRTDHEVSVARAVRGAADNMPFLSAQQPRRQGSLLSSSASLDRAPAFWFILVVLCCFLYCLCDNFFTVQLRFGEDCCNRRRNKTVLRIDCCARAHVQTLLEQGN